MTSDPLEDGEDGERGRGARNGCILPSVPTHRNISESPIVSHSGVGLWGSNGGRAKCGTGRPVAGGNNTPSAHYPWNCNMRHCLIHTLEFSICALGNVDDVWA